MIQNPCTTNLWKGRSLSPGWRRLLLSILLRQEDDIRRLAGELKMPVNILAVPGYTGVARLQEIGVCQAEPGSGFLKVAVKAMRDLAMDLKAGRGLDRVTGNDVTSDYLQQLVGTRND